MGEFGLPAAINDDYLTDTNNDAVLILSGTTEEQVEQIITQKYIASTGNGLEAWNVYRRTVYPNFAEHFGRSIRQMFGAGLRFAFLYL